MLPRIIHTITTDTEAVEGNKASPVRPRRREASDSTCEPKKDPNQ
jgi:hypothetical protein